MLPIIVKITCRKGELAQIYNVKYDAKNPHFWAKIGLPNGCDVTYVCSAVKASNYFMPKATLSDRGPGGGGWILINLHLQAMEKLQNASLEPWAGGRVFAIGDCNWSCVGDPPEWDLPPIPKVAYAGEEQAVLAARNIKSLDRMLYSALANKCCGCIPKPQLSLTLLFKKPLGSTWYPWGAGVFAVSLGREDGVFITGCNHQKGSGEIKCRGRLSAVLNELIESTKMGQCRGNSLIASTLWYLIHHWPINLWGEGPLLP